MNPAVRVGGATLVALIVTTFLFWLMQYLIATGVPALTEAVKGASIEFVRVQRDETVQTKDRKPPEKPQQEDAPPPPPPSAADTSNAPGSMAIGMNAPNMGKDLNLNRNNIEAPSDGDAIPLVRVPPQYPERAASRGIEGWVQLGFTVNETGGCEEIRVLAADPPEIFDRAAIRALERWRYKPKIEDGRPVKQYNQQVVITFDLENQ
ncbi:MAG: energy transducer TonB [Rhodospirillaceae bacterium]|nr:energy transducer TonB [Rhodospirillaceae bacterium]